MRSCHIQISEDETEKGFDHERGEEEEEEKGKEKKKREALYI